MKIELNKFLSEDYNKLLRAGGLTSGEAYAFTRHLSDLIHYMERTDELFLEDSPHGCLEIAIDTELPEIKRRHRMKWNKHRCKDNTFECCGETINYRFVYKEQQ